MPKTGKKSAISNREKKEWVIPVKELLTYTRSTSFRVITWESNPEHVLFKHQGLATKVHLHHKLFITQF